MIPDTNSFSGKRARDQDILATFTAAVVFQMTSQDSFEYPNNLTPLMLASFIWNR